MSEQNHLPETHVRQFVQPVHDRRGRAHQAPSANPKPSAPNRFSASRRTSGRDASSGASAITASTDITIVSGSRPTSAQMPRSTSTLCRRSPSAYVGTFQTSA